MEKRIYKSERNRVLTGTCGGIGEYLNIDPTIVRLIFVGIVFFNGIGIFAYIVAALLIPNSPIDNFENMNNRSEYNHSRKSDRKRKDDDDDFDSYFEK